MCRSSWELFRAPFSGLLGYVAYHRRSRLRGYSYLRVRDNCVVLQCVCLLHRSKRRNSVGSSCMCRVPFIWGRFSARRLAVSVGTSRIVCSGLREYSYLSVRSTRPQRITVYCCSVFVCCSKYRNSLASSCVYRVLFIRGSFFARLLVVSLGTSRIAAEADCVDTRILVCVVLRE